MLRVLGVILSLLLAGLLAWAVWIWLQRPAALPPMQPVATQQAAGTEVGIHAPEGRFKSGPNRFQITFRTPNGEPVEPAEVRAQFYMPAMGAMPAMQAPADLQRTAPGEMSGQVELPMGGEWQLRLSFETPAGSQNVRVMINAQ